MLVETTGKQGSFYNVLYQMIPDYHILKRINSAISISFVNELLADGYCRDFGSPAKEPEMLLRIQILKYLYNLSDEHLIHLIQIFRTNLAEELEPQKRRMAAYCLVSTDRLEQLFSYKAHVETVALIERK